MPTSRLTGHWDPDPGNLEFSRTLIPLLSVIKDIEEVNAQLKNAASTVKSEKIEQYHVEGWNTAELVRPPGRGVNFQIEAEDNDAILLRLRENHILLYRTPRDNYYRTGDAEYCQREFLVQDPDGYLRRFSQYIG